MTSKLVQSFNALPRHSKTPSGLVPNEWHFDIRYVHLEKTPSHILAIIQPESRYFHMERLPIGLSTESSGIAFFPESAKEAAPQVAKAILYAFVQRLGQKQMMTFSGSMTSTDQLAPWRLTTEDKALATAVGAEFKRLGVCPDALCRIGVSTTSMNKIMQDKFHNLFRGLMKMVGIKDHISPFISTPMSIVFQKLHPRAHPKPSEGEDGKLELALNYAQELCRSRPLKSNEEVGAASLGIVEEIKAVQKMITERPVNLVKAEADAGDPESAFDYGLRLLVGLGCEYDRTLARAYIIKALSSTRASDELKCAAHGTLINWYMSADEKTLPTRYLFTASHHANIAASLCRRVSPPGAPASPAVLWFMSRVFEPHSHNVPELMYFFKDAWRAWEDRTAQMAAGREKMEEKRLKYPNRYRCAAVGCGIEADTGKMLQKCAGKCDTDKKPSYCSKECQKADWRNHKPFCRAGAPCSVIDTVSSSLGGPPSKEGALRIPITRPDGSTMLLSSSTLDRQSLKEIRDYAENDGRGSFPNALTIELDQLHLGSTD